jgi:hypothetical protein
MHVPNNVYNSDCVFTVIEVWQQCVEMVRQSGGDNRHYAVLADEEWLNQQYRNLMNDEKKRSIAP